MITNHYWSRRWNEDFSHWGRILISQWWRGMKDVDVGDESILKLIRLKIDRREITEQWMSRARTARIFRVLVCNGEGFRRDKPHDVMQRWMSGPARIVIRLRIYKYHRIVIRDVTSAKIYRPWRGSIKSTIMLHSHQVSSSHRRQKLLPVEGS